MSRAYYNEFDPKAAAWLRELIKRGLIADGDVDDRSITDVRPADLAGYDQHHFFAGIGGWSLALRLSGWTDDRPVWTGSCPCQPFSSAGKQQGEADPRHLLPVFARLIRECRPDTVFGEQVANAIGHGWLDGVCAEMEAEGYTCGACVLGAHSVGAPHIRQRLYWVADSNGKRCNRKPVRLLSGGSHPPCPEVARSSDVCVRCGRKWDYCTCVLPGPFRLGDCGGMAHTQRDGGGPDEPGRGAEWRAADGRTGGVADAARGGQRIDGGASRDAGHADQLGEIGDFWSDSAWLPCRDGKARRIGVGIAPLVRKPQPGPSEVAHGVPGGMVPGGDCSIAMVPGGDCSIAEAQNTAEARVMRLRGYGNAIVPPLAAEFIAAVREWMEPCSAWL